jgi:hypothetical protein
LRKNSTVSEHDAKVDALVCNPLGELAILEPVRLNDLNSSFQGPDLYGWGEWLEPASPWTIRLTDRRHNFTDLIEGIERRQGNCRRSEEYTAHDGYLPRIGAVCHRVMTPDPKLPRMTEGAGTEIRSNVA